ncbi:Cys-tRNA(Pro) deacylase [Sphingobacterium sp. 2149]|uniref:Cys-tRNA(Pro) deacylase n=1 Tax=Sphingobacterium sp. 2149 TaxID=2817763 RepID=UPI001AE6A8F2|nr:Cys-tRNA(Pro) deacylase [Sphingobacterium sp. 2149]MDR6737061.1 Cys-tRNA(Pro)/Cys-tRNA(Cys) deacylase [Sphingobacterium sp. 2149]
MSSKTNAVRLLETAGIRYELREYEVDEQDVSAEHVAETLGLPLETLYKTLVLKGNKDAYIVAVIPGNAHLDLKKLAKASGNKNCEMLPMKDLLTVTGYIRGGCSPIGMKKQFPTFIEEAAQLETLIAVSAGKRGLQMVLNPVDLANIAHADWSDLIGY